MSIVIIKLYKRFFFKKKWAFGEDQIKSLNLKKKNIMINIEECYQILFFTLIG